MMNINEDAYYASMLNCAKRYSEMAKIDEDLNDRSKSNSGELSPFIEEFQAGCHSRLPLLKLNRWLGFIQGTLIARGVTTVEDERNYTRPLFRPLDFT